MYLLMSVLLRQIPRIGELWVSTFYVKKFFLRFFNVCLLTFCLRLSLVQLILE